MRKDFVANASHELRSPLTVIAGYLEQLADDPELETTWREPVADMRRQAERMREIVEDLLELSRLEAGPEDAPLAPVDLPQLLTGLVQEARVASAAPPQFKLEIDSAEGVLGSERELHSIASNLISNAAKYTPATGSVTVRWSCDGAGGHLAVADTGIGIAAEHLPRLTERFLSGRSGRAARQRRIGSGPVHRQARTAAPWRLARDCERGRARFHVHRALPAAPDRNRATREVQPRQRLT